jgi:hypothetical protein
MSTTYHPLYEHIEEVEKLDYYRPGGYHPIQIGDRFQNRYQIVHKLGHGSYSTIWLAQDVQTVKYVAIKVGTADYGPKGAKLLSRISASAAKDTEFGVNLTPLVLGRFSIDGPNGTHPCFITVPARCSLVDAARAAGNSPFQLSVARSLSAQLAMAVAHIHQLECVHGVSTLALLFPDISSLISARSLHGRHTSPATKP